MLPKVLFHYVSLIRHAFELRPFFLYACNYTTGATAWHLELLATGANHAAPEREFSIKLPADGYC